MSPPGGRDAAKGWEVGSEPYANRAEPSTRAGVCVRLEQEGAWWAMCTQLRNRVDE